MAPDGQGPGDGAPYGVVPEAARQRLVSRFSLEDTVPSWALAYAFDIVLRGRDATPFEAHDEDDEA